MSIGHTVNQYVPSIHLIRSNESNFFIISGPYCDFNRYIIKESDLNEEFNADISKSFLKELDYSIKEYSEGVYTPKIVSV